MIALAIGYFLKPREVEIMGVAKLAGFMGLLLALQWFFVTVPFGARGYGYPLVDAAASYLDANGARGRMFNEVESGAALLGLSSRPVFVDSRLALYGAEFIRDAMRWSAQFKFLDDVYGFDYAVILNRRTLYPAQALDEAADWRLAFADDTALIYARRDGKSAELVKDRADSLLQPNRLWPDSLDEALGGAKTRARAMQELERWVNQSPDSAQALIWRGYALDRVNEPLRAQPLLRSAESRPALTRDPELMAALGFVRESRGEGAGARKLYQSAALIARRRGERRLEAEILAKAAQSHRAAGLLARPTPERRARSIAPSPAR